MVSPKQGDSLDPLLGVKKGWWVKYPRVFLFTPPPIQEFTQIYVESGKPCFGFNAIKVAAEFGITPSDVVLNNAIQALSVREETGIKSPGAESAINFIFELPHDGKIIVSIQSTEIKGSA